MENVLQGDERLDYLLAEDLRIIQSPSVFSFSLDAVLFRQAPQSSHGFRRHHLIMALIT